MKHSPKPAGFIAALLALAASAAQAATPSTFTWAAAVAGKWSDGSKWTSDLASGAAPAAAGQASYTLNFSQAGSYTVTHDLNDGFVLNTLNFAGAVTLDGTCGLALTANGPTLPQINQNSDKSVSIGIPVSLAADVTLGGTGTGAVAFSGAISGSGKLTMSNPGQLSLMHANTYSGGTLITAGNLYVGAHQGGTLGAAGAENVTIAKGATLTGERANFVGNLTLNGGTWAENNGFGGSWTGPVTLAATSTLNSGYFQTIKGVVSGPGGLIHAGGGTLALTGASTFTGAMTLAGGTLSVASFNSVSGGTPSSDLGAPSTAASGTIALGTSTTAGNLLYTGPGETTDRVLQLASTTGGATLTQAGTASGMPTTRGTSGLLKFTGNVSIPGTAGTDNRKTLTLTQANTPATGTNPGRGEISGSIGDSLLGNAGQLATSLTKAGSGTWTLSGSNTYSGATKVQAGTLAFSRADALGGGALDITAGSKVQLNYIGTRQVAALTFDGGSALPNGTYGSSSSPASNKDDARFAGLGTVTVGAIAAPTTTTLARSSGSSPSNGGISLTFTATVAGSKPSGNVMFYDGLGLIGSSALNAASQASVTTSTLGGGSHAITALYVGSAGNSPSSSGPLIQVVTENRAATTATLALTSGANPSAAGAAVTFTATVAGKAPTGSVTFYDGVTPLATAAVNGSAQAVLTTSALPVGWRAITARYAGDSNNAPGAATPALFQSVRPPAGNGKVKVFILAGQSNMVAHCWVETGRDPNHPTNTSFVGGLGSLRNMLNREPNKYGYLADPAHPTAAGNPGWLTCKNVWVAYWGESNDLNRKGMLDADFGDNGGVGAIGPEYGFGLTVGSHLGDQVLLIKYAFGGKSLIADFRPPSSGGKVGPYYTGMIARTRQVLDNLGTFVPGYTGGGYEIAGFGWHQGWNDAGEATAVYETNLVNLIKDLRSEFKAPKLPVVIGNTGMANSYAGNVIVAQMNVGNPALHPEFAGTVASVDTRPFDFGERLSASGDGTHWNHNAESYFKVGESMGQAMVRMLAAAAATDDTARGRR